MVVSRLIRPCLPVLRGRRCHYPSEDICKLIHSSVGLSIEVVINDIHTVHKVALVFVDVLKTWSEMFRGLQNGF